MTTSTSRIAGGAGLATAAIGGCVLLGWTFGVDLMKSLLPGLIVMIPNTALGMMLGGAAVWLRRSAPPRHPGLASVLSIAVLLLGALTFVERITGRGWGIDLVLFADAVRRYPYLPPGRMATNSAVCFVLAGIALVTDGSRHPLLQRVRQPAAALGLGIASLAVLGYFFGARPLYAIDQAAGMALMTAIGFFCLHLGILAAPPPPWIVLLITGNDPGGQLIRRTLPASIATILVLGWVWIRAREAQVVSLEGGVALSSLIIIATITILVVRSAAMLRGADAQRGHHLVREIEAKERAERLQRITAGLAPLSSVVAVGAFFSRELADALGAQISWVGGLSPDGAFLETLGSYGVADEVVDPWRRYAVDARLPICDALRDGQPQWWETRQQLIDVYPAYATTLREMNREAVAIVPLLVGDGMAARPVGGLSVGFSTSRPFDAATRAFVLTLAQQCALALDRARLYEAERVARRDAEEANRAKTQFFATMSHELRTPLNAIAGHVQLIELGVHGPTTDAQRNAISRVILAQNRLLSLVNDVLDLSKIEAGKLEYDIRPVALFAVVGSVVALIEPMARAKGLVVSISRPETIDGTDADVAVLADQTKLGQILLNLLSNAVKFTPSLRPDGSPGSITIDLGMQDGTSSLAYVRVSDTGIGVPLDMHDTIFDPFVQVSNGLTRSTEGAGLGLAISRVLARGMGGNLRVRSLQHEGSRFTLTLRRAEG